MEETEDIYNIAQQIFTQEPQDANSIQLSIINNANPAILFEVLSILFCECLQIKLPNIIRNQGNIDNFIITLKEYFYSFGMNFNYEKINLNEHTGEFFHILPYQVNRRYFFGVRTEFIYYDLLIPYEPDIHMTDELNNLKLLIRIQDHIYRINFKLLR